MRIVELVVPRVDAEAGADRLWGAGARAVEEVDLAADSVALRTVLAADDAASLARLGRMPVGWDVRFVEVDDAPSEAWRATAVPIEINDELIVRPAWVDTSASPDTTVIAIEPAGSFGLGDHPTTRLSLDAVWRLVRPGQRVLDVGCGSGVLAIAAVLRGADHAIAIDVAEAAREATVANSRRNGVADRVSASCRPLAAIDGRFDIVLANILAPILIELADDLRRVLAPTGRLVVSGVLAGRFDHVTAALAPLVPARVHELDGWACVEFDAGR